MRGAFASLACVVAGSTLLAGLAWARQPRPEGTGLEEIERLPAGVRLGLRVLEQRQGVRVASTVVIVPDAGSFVRAIGAWTPTGQFPVLIDDGTPAAREHVARFVRGFRPARVVEWSAGAETPGATRETIERALAHAVGAGEGEEARATILRGNPFGVVVTSEADPGWPAALALAAGRGQLLAWMEVPGTPAGVLARGDAEALCARLEEQLEEWGAPWKGVGVGSGAGVGVDAVTLCLNVPVKYGLDEQNHLALSDRVGRQGAEDVPARWAWCGQVLGDEPASAYAAMGALFLTPRSAWLFDGYPGGEPWSAYDATPAGDFWRERGLEVEVLDAPRQGEADWRERARGAIPGGVVMVNTKGNADFFELAPGICRPGDVPILQTPAMAYVVHSWSAQWPARRDTVGGRWLERGAYCYTGSVQEPYLQAFVPTPKAAVRLGAGMPWGVATRLDRGPIWKLAVLGDPLAMGVGAAQAVDVPVPLAGVRPLEDDLRGALREGEFGRALSCLLRLGRDADARRLVSALRQEKPGTLSEEACRLAVLPCFRAGAGVEELAWLVGQLGEARPGDAPQRDALWLACGARLALAKGERVFEVLARQLRDDLAERDALELARAMSGELGRVRAMDRLGEIRRGTPAGPRGEALDRAIESLGPR